MGKPYLKFHIIFLFINHKVTDACLFGFPTLQSQSIRTKGNHPVPTYHSMIWILLRIHINIFFVFFSEFYLKLIIFSLVYSWRPHRTRKVCVLLLFLPKLLVLLPIEADAKQKKDFLLTSEERAAETRQEGLYSSGTAVRDDRKLKLFKLKEKQNQVLLWRSLVTGE